MLLSSALHRCQSVWSGENQAYAPQTTLWQSSQRQAHNLRGGGKAIGESPTDKLAGSIHTDAGADMSEKFFQSIHTKCDSRLATELAASFKKKNQVEIDGNLNGCPADKKPDESKKSRNVQKHFELAWRGLEAQPPGRTWPAPVPSHNAPRGAHRRQAPTRAARRTQPRMAYSRALNGDLHKHAAGSAFTYLRVASCTRRFSVSYHSSNSRCCVIRKM